MSVFNFLCNQYQNLTTSTKNFLLRSNRLKLPKCELSQIISRSETIPVTLIDYRYTVGNMGINELVTLAKVVRYCHPKIIFEIGTFVGNTTLQLAANSNAQIYTLDLPPHSRKIRKIWDPEIDVYPDKPGVRFQKTAYTNRTHQLFGNSYSYNFSKYFKKVDLVFIDGCHHYRFVKKDTMNAFKMVSPGGVIIWHDYAFYAPGVVRILNETSKKFSLMHIKDTSLVFYRNNKFS